MSFAAQQLGFAYGLREATFQLPAAGLITVAGPNGAGKSTLLGILGGLRSPYTGSCTYAGREIREWGKREYSRRVAFLPQLVRVEFPFTAEEVVLMGRTPHGLGWFDSEQDRAFAENAMATTDTLPFRERDFRSLSGGERQRVILASALAQQPATLLLDEPATHLDLRHQLSLYRLLADLGQAMLVVAVTHDLNLALQFSTHMMVLNNGRIAAEGPPGDVLHPGLIERVFGVKSVVRRGMNGNRWMVYEP